MRVDEPRRERHPIGVNLPVRFRTAQVADRYDPVANNADIGTEPGPAQSVEYDGIPDDQIAASRHVPVPSVSFME
jgi:hypothetical protein